MPLQPVFSNLDASLTLEEEAFASGPVRIDANVSISSPEGTGFKGGVLEISLEGATADDYVGIAHAGGITISGSKVLYNGVKIGTIVSDGAAASPLSET